MTDLSSKLAELAALSEKAPHTTKMSDKCGFLNDRGEVCGKLYDERRHARYGSQLEYPGYHLFENDWVHDEENCLRCAVRTELKELVGRANVPSGDVQDFYNRWAMWIPLEGRQAYLDQLQNLVRRDDF